MNEFYELASKLISEILDYHFDLNDTIKHLKLKDKLGNEFIINRNLMETELIFFRTYPNGFKKITLYEFGSVMFCVIEKPDLNNYCQYFDQKDLIDEKIIELANKFLIHRLII